MKNKECKPCKWFGPKPGSVRPTVCCLSETNEPPQIPIKTIIWCKIFEERNKEEKHGD